MERPENGSSSASTTDTPQVLRPLTLKRMFVPFGIVVPATSAVAPEVARLAESVELFCLSPHRNGGAELALDLAELSRCLNLLNLKASEMAATFAGTDEYDRQCAYSPIHWLRTNCHLTAGAAADRVAVGQLVQSVPQSVEAMAGGEIGFAHLALIAREAEAAAETGLDSFDETKLLEKARNFTVGRFRNFCHHQRHALDPQQYAAEEASAIEARSFSLQTGQGGMVWIRGLLDPEGGNALRTALEPLARRNGKADHRKRDRRLGDAIVELAQHGHRSHLQVTASLETLLQHSGAPAADLEFSLPISSAAVQRLACDCNVTRILLGAESQVIDVGRSTRTVSAPMRRALDTRDKGCRWPGCDRPARWSAAHHVVHWSKGGTTDLGNLVLLCARHHWMVHEGGWQIVRTEGPGYKTVPPHLDWFASRARGPDTWAA